MKNPTSAIYYLRTREGLSQKKLAKKVNLTPNDISRLENAQLGTSIGKFSALAKYFSVSVNALVRNNFDEIFKTFSNKPNTSETLQKRIKKRQELCDRIGQAGEAWVHELEIEKLANSKYPYAINQNFADSDDAHFDFMSINFDENGNWEFVCIEVKSTNSGADEPFFISAKEFEMVKFCLANNLRYEVHRVYYVEDAKKRGRIIYPAHDLLTKFEIVPDNYIVRKKVG